MGKLICLPMAIRQAVAACLAVACAAFAPLHSTGTAYCLHAPEAARRVPPGACAASKQRCCSDAEGGPGAAERHDPSAARRRQINYMVHQLSRLGADLGECVRVVRVALSV